MLNQTKYNSITVLQSSITEQSVMVDCPDREEKTAIVQSYSTDRADELLSAHSSQIDRLIPLRHPNIQSIIEVFVEEHNLHLVTGAVQGKRAATQVPLSAERCEKLLKDILPVLTYLHDRGITHGNISPDTILFQAQNQPVLTEFQAITELKIAAGGEVYPPIDRQLREIPVTNIPSEQQFDLYSLGVTTICLLSNRELNHLYDPNTHKWQWENHLGSNSGKLLRAIDRLLNNPTSAAEVLQEFQIQSRVILDAPIPNSDTIDRQFSIYPPLQTPTISTSDRTTTVLPPPTNFQPTQTNIPQPPAENKSLQTLLIGGIGGALILFVGMSIGQKNYNPPILNSPISASTDRSSPEASIAQYYQEINSRQYQSAWEKLPTSLQENSRIHPKGFQSFVDFFNSLSGIEVNNLKTIERTESRAIVSADLNCQLTNGRQSPLFLNFTLNWNNSNQKWQISKIKFDPDRKSYCGSESTSTPAASPLLSPSITSINSVTPISKDEAVNLVQRWLNARSQMFAPPYNQEVGKELTTGKAYSDKIHGPSSDGTDTSTLEWLKKFDYYYVYNSSEIGDIKRFQQSGNDAILELSVIDDKIQYDRQRKVVPQNSGNSTSLIRYRLRYDYDKWKIADIEELQKVKN
jgi:serine/threonine protein kinase